MVGVNLHLDSNPQGRLQVLQQVWGYTAFREPQESVILNALAGNDGLVVMATGGGKSLCYQVPPLVSGQPCVVISPLIALMEDQVAALNARGVKAAFLGSAQTSNEVKRKAWQGEYQLIYITPELACKQTSQLQQLHANRRIGLIAVDEAHCVSEWGHDFRVDYRNLGCLRQALPGVPILAVTATATQRVRQDILNNLGMGRPGGPPLQQWVMSFQRTNLHLSVQLKSGCTVANNLSGLVAEANEAQAKGLRTDSTLVYAQTVREVDEITAHLQAKGIPAVKYHAKMSLGDRMSSHRSFQRDDSPVMVATVAFGMGIDKPNIRRIIHFGVPSSLESYYQQVGRAGRDGLPSQCCLMWCPQDFNTVDLIKGAQGLSGWNLESHSRGMAALRTYTNSGDCRHATLVNFFQPGTLQADGPCTGGCDNCKRRAEAVAAAASGGTQSAAGVPLGQTDVTEPARLLVATVKGLKNCFGTARAVAVLRGSKAKNVDPWMMELRDQNGNLLHGAGSSRSDDWWKGLAGVLMGQGYLQSQHKSAASGQAYSVLQVTQKGHQFLSRPTAKLHVMLPLHMEAEESKKQLRETAERQRAAAREAAQQQRGEVESEKEQLLVALKETRKQIADTLNQAPDTLVNDATLNQIKELRPTTDDELVIMGGFGAKALMHFAVPLLQVVKQFCADSKHLKPTTDWHYVRQSKDAAHQRGLQQANGQFALWNQQQQQQGPAAVQSPVFTQFSMGTPTPGANGAGLMQQQAGGSVQQRVGVASQSAGLGGPMLMTDSQLHQSFIDNKVLSEPKGAATAAWDRFEAGETAEQIASNRDKPIQASTVIGYLAEAAASAGLASGCPQALLQRLQHEAGMAGSPSAEALLWKVVCAVSGEGIGLVALKTALPDDVSYGQIKLAASLLSLQALPQLDVANCQLEPPTVSVDWSPAVNKLLSQPGAAAQQLYARWRAGVPIGVLGSLDGMNMQLQAVLSALAEMAAAGYPADMQQLADAAQLSEASALQIAAAVRAAGPLGIQAVKQQLEAHVGYGQIKVVAALMAVKALWFSPEAVAVRELEDLADMDEMTAEPVSRRQTAGGQQAAGESTLQQHNNGPAGAASVAAGAQAGSSSTIRCQLWGSQAPDATSAVDVCAAQAAGGCVNLADAAATAANTPAPQGATAANDVDGDLVCSGPAAGSVDSAAAAGRKRPGFVLGNKSGKRKRPTAIAPPPAAVKPLSAGVRTTAEVLPASVQAGNTSAAAMPAPGPVGPAASAAATPASAARPPVQEQHQLHCTPGVSWNTPALSSAANASQAQSRGAAVVTPASAIMISQETVLRLLWSGGCTAVQMKAKLGVTGSLQEQQLQQILQRLLEEGDQVCTTPATARAAVDLNDDCVKFIAF